MMIQYIKALVASRNIVRLDKPISGDLDVLEVGRIGNEDVVRVRYCAESAQEGVQSLFWDNRRGHAVVEVSCDPFLGVSDLKVIRNLGASLSTLSKPWLSGWLGDVPEDFGFEEYSTITLSNQTRAWLFTSNSNRWVIHIHGRKAAKGETLRNLKQFRDLNFKQLVISHESDAKPDGLGTKVSYLGDREWSQVEIAVKYAKQHGAREIILFGWSLGAMFVGQFMKRSECNSLVTGVIYDSPLIDYETTFQLQSQNAGYDEEFGSYVYKILKTSKLLGLFALRRKDIPTLILPVTFPLLVLYSSSDGYVSMAKVDQLLKLNKQANAVEILDARHCRLFNKDKITYQASISDFLSSLGI